MVKKSRTFCGRPSWIVPYVRSFRFPSSGLAPPLSDRTWKWGYIIFELNEPRAALHAHYHCTGQVEPVPDSAPFL